MDRKAVVAIGLCVVVLFLWRPALKRLGYGQYVERERPAPTAVVDSARRDTSPASSPPTTAPPAAGVPAPGAPAEKTGQSAPVLARGPFRPPVGIERTIAVETPLYSATFSNRGARLLSLELKRFASAHGVSSVGGQPRRGRRGQLVPPGDRVVLAGGPLFGMDLGSREGLRSLENATYAVTESLDAAGERRVLTFTAEDSSGLRIRQTYRVRPGDYAIDLEVEIRNVPVEWPVPDYSLTTRSWPLLTDVDLPADARALRATSLIGTSFHSDRGGGLLKSARFYDGNVLWAAVQTRYFMSAIAVSQAVSRAAVATGERYPLSPQQLALLPAGSKPEQELVTNSLVVGLPPASHPVQRFVLYVGPCEYFRLAALGLKLERAVDLGWNWVRPFSAALLWLMTRLFGFLQNYGIAILALATLVRVLLHPLNMISMRSMRAMQKLQPELERIKEKYKSDAQAMNAAVMALYKGNKVNPAGGCLPMLIQMPLFVALYQVLFNAIELRQAAFVGWMNDLSAPDHLFSVGPFPVRLLPLLMLGSGFLSQKLTPSDPRQLPTMYMMNVVMLVFFYNLPSGLVLYWTVMNLLTALQQWMVLRQDGHTPAATQVAVVADAGGKKRRTVTR